MRLLFPLFAAASLTLSACSPPAFAAEDAVKAPAAARAAHETPGLKVAIFSGGCFWGIEGVFSHVKGVTSAVSGYHGGSASTADYSAVSTGTTGHAESVRVTYDPQVVRYDQLLQIFFSVGANPTEKNRQGPDYGTQYRSALVPLSTEQTAVARAYLAQLRRSGLWSAPIVTRIEGNARFYPAEAYHQDYLYLHPNAPYIAAWDMPKISALKAMYPAFYSPIYKRG